MNNNEIFEFEGSFYIIKQDLYEIREDFIERVWFILHKKKTYPNMSFIELIKLARIQSNIKKLGCKYSTNLINKI